MDFEIEEAIKIANSLVYQRLERNLKDVEISVIRGSWEKLDYDQIAAQNKYAASYISQDAAPELWKILSSATGEKVRKSNFKSALKRCWQKSHATELNQFAMLTQNEEKDSNRLSNKVRYLNTINKTHTATLTDRYISRPAAELAGYEALQKPGALLRIRAPRYMGKTTFSNRLLQQFSAIGYQTITINLELADRETHLTSIEKLLYWLCLNIDKDIDRAKDYSSPVKDIWEREIGAKTSCNHYFEKYLLDSIKEPLILCLDNLDVLFSHTAVCRDICDLLRDWNKKFASEKFRQTSVWQKLRVVVVYNSKRDRTHAIDRALINVGQPIDLGELSKEQVEKLAYKHKIISDSHQISNLINWIGGHPYLLEKAFLYTKHHFNSSLKNLLTEETKIIEIYQDYLRDLWIALQEETAVMEAFTKLVCSSQPTWIEPALAYQLQQLNLVKQTANGTVVSCNLYIKYFSRYL